MARQTNTRAGDYTGTAKAALAKEHAEEQAARAQELGLITAAQAEADKEPVDLAPRQPEVHEVIVDDVAVQAVDVQEEIVKFRVNETLDMVTIGHGNHYDFEEGREYRAPKSIFTHLEEKGLIWH
jgi:hypothetical protein